MPFSQHISTEHLKKKQKQVVLKNVQTAATLGNATAAKWENRERYDFLIARFVVDSVVKET